MSSLEGNNSSSSEEVSEDAKVIPAIKIERKKSDTIIVKVLLANKDTYDFYYYGLEKVSSIILLNIVNPCIGFSFFSPILHL